MGYSNGALNICSYEGQRVLVVIPVHSILSVVAMIPFGEQGEGTQRVFLIEKFALGVVNTGVIED